MHKIENNSFKDTSFNHHKYESRNKNDNIFFDLDIKKENTLINDDNNYISALLEKQAVDIMRKNQSA